MPSGIDADADDLGPGEPGSADEPEERSRLVGSRLLLVEDDGALARALARLIDRAGCSVTWTQDGESACSIAAQASPPFDAALVDVRLPDTSGFNVVYALRNGAQPCSAVVMTGVPGPECVRESVIAGVSDFLVKPFKTSLMLASIARAMEHTRTWRLRLASHVGRVPLDGAHPREASQVGADGSPGTAAAPAGKLDLEGAVAELARRGGLTLRERETVELLLCGYRNDEIAIAFAISAHTVKYHVRNILRKLDLATRADLLRLLLE